nr:hypothetical protein [Tanacetum cinerariifolium]
IQDAVQNILGNEKISLRETTLTCSDVVRKRTKGIEHQDGAPKCHADEPLVVPLDGLHFDDKLQFVEEPVEIMDCEGGGTAWYPSLALYLSFALLLSSSLLFTLLSDAFSYTSLLLDKSLSVNLSNKSDVSESASNSSVNESEKDNNQANDRYKADEGYHAVPPTYTGNFMHPRPDLSFARLDDYVFKSAISEFVTSINETKTSTSKTSKESMEKPKTVRPNAPIIED